MRRRWHRWKRAQRSAIRYAFVPVGFRLVASGVQPVYGVVTFEERRGL